MSFASVDDVIAAEGAGNAQVLNWIKIATWTGVAGANWSLWSVPGSGGTGAFGTDENDRQVTSATTGALPFTNAGASNTLNIRYVNATGLTSDSNSGTLYIVDRLLDYTGIETNTNATQTMTVGDGLSRYSSTAAAGNVMWLEVDSSTALGATPATVIINYDDQAGNAQNAPAVDMVVSAAQYRIPHVPLFLPLASGDTGIREVNSVTFSADMGGGAGATVTAVIGRVLATIPIPSGRIAIERDLVLQIPALPRVYDGAAISFLWVAAAAVNNPVFQGEIRLVEG
jgi:hypothetical protein